MVVKGRVQCGASSQDLPCCVTHPRPFLSFVRFDHLRCDACSSDSCDCAPSRPLSVSVGSTRRTAHVIALLASASQQQSSVDVDGSLGANFASLVEFTPRTIFGRQRFVLGARCTDAVCGDKRAMERISVCPSSSPRSIRAAEDTLHVQRLDRREVVVRRMRARRYVSLIRTV